MVQNWTDTVAEALERLDVADTLEELRHHIDALISRLGESEARATAAETAQRPERDTKRDVKRDAKPDANHDEALDKQIDSLGKKVEFASDMLAQLTDLLESQNERIETIEQQIGDPDVEGHATYTTGAGAAADPALRREIAALAVERERLGERITQLEATVTRLETTIETVRDLTFEREERVRDLEDRLLVALDSRNGEQANKPEVIPVVTLPSRAARTSFASPALATPMPLPPPPTAAPAAVSHLSAPSLADPALHQPMDPATARRLEDLVEREIKLQHEFSPGASGDRAQRPGRATIMVVDDSVDARTILSIYLSRTGYQVVTAASAEDCLAKLRHHRVDAVILDATMPGGGGEHVLRVLGSSGAAGTTAPCGALIVYTAHPDVLSREKALQLGASDYLVKGGDLLPLLTMLVRHLNPSAQPAL